MSASQSAVTKNKTIRISEACPVNTTIHDVNDDTHLILNRNRSFEPVNWGDAPFILDGSFIKLVSPFDFETKALYELTIKASGDELIFPRFKRELSIGREKPPEYLPSHETTLMDMVIAWRNWHLVFTEHKFYICTYKIELLDEGTFLESGKELNKENPISLLSWKNSPLDIEIGTIETSGDNLNSAEFTNEGDKKFFDIKRDGNKIILSLKKGSYTSFLDQSGITQGIDKLVYYILKIKVSDKGANDPNANEGSVKLYFKIDIPNDLPSTIPNSLTFDSLVQLANNKAPTKSLSEILDIVVPETSERNLMVISETLKERLNLEK